MRTLALLALLAAAAGSAEVTDADLAARFPYDLGPAEVDVSGYPDPAKKGYALYRRSCTACHTGARALNSPLSKREDWARYVKRMHVKGKSKKGAEVSRDDAAAIVEFLTHDSKVRKLDRRDEFEAAGKTLEERFKLVRAERERRQRKDSESKAVPPAPYTGAKP